MRPLLFALFMSAATLSNAATLEKFSFGRFGPVVVYRPMHVEHAVLFFSDADGWSQRDALLAEALADKGVLVAGIDWRHYASELAKPRDKCSYLAGEFEDFSHELQKRYSPERYHMPVLVGVGDSAMLVYAITAQGSPATFLGALTIGFRPAWSPPLKLCQSYELKYASDVPGTVNFKPSPQLSTPWIELHARDDRTIKSNELDAFIKAVGTARVEYVAAGGLNGEDISKWREPMVASVLKLAAPDRDAKVVANELRDLPLEEVPATGTRTTKLALFLTGDGGWAAIDKGVSAELAKRGVDVVALSSLQYFWKPRSPDDTARDAARILRHYLTKWRKTEVLVIGYSFGADVAAFVVNRLPSDLKARVRTVSLLGLAETADFEVHVTTWLGVDHHGVPTVAEVDQLGARVLCVYGEGENDSACGLLKGSNVRAAKIGDGHHFGNRYREIAEAILALADGV